MRLSRGLVACGLVLGLGACTAYYNDFDVINRSGVEIRDISVSDGTTEWKLGSLKPGATTTFHGHLSGEDTGTVSWTFNGKRYSGDGCFYTVGGSTHGTLLVAGDHLEYQCT